MVIWEEKNAFPQALLEKERGSKQPIDFAYGHIQPQAPEVEKAILGAQEWLPPLMKDFFALLV